MRKENIKQKLCLLLTICFLSCKNDDEPPNNNEMKATVTFSSGEILRLDATGTNVEMGCSIWGGTFVNGYSGTNGSNGVVTFIAFGSTAADCVPTPGTYSFSCEYRKDNGANSAIYSNLPVQNRGTVTFTSINNHMEGSFIATCRCFSSSGCVYDVDSVVVSGTFKGDHLLN